MQAGVATAAAAELPDNLSMRDLYDVLKLYNDVTQRLEHSHKRLESEVARLHDQLEQKNRELELKNRLAALGEMAAGMAHEIRNPLGGIALYASTLAKDLSDRPRAVELLQKISRQVRHLNELVNGILGFTQHVRCEKSSQTIGQIVADAVDAAGGALAENQVRVTIGNQTPMLAAPVDAALLQRALLNLLLNAAQAIGEGRATATRPMGQIVVNVMEAADNQLLLEVRDDGPGIPAAALEKIFHPFYTTRESGTGLGLAIVHRIVVAHGGRITVENRPEGGAQFMLFLPAA